MKRDGYNMNKKIRDTKGVTLVEMVVTFAMISIFMAAATACISPMLKTYEKMQSFHQQEMICDSVAEEIQSYIKSMNSEADAGYITLYSPQTTEEGIRNNTGVSLSLDSEKTTEGDGLQFIDYKGYMSEIDSFKWEGYKINKKRQLIDYFDFPTGYANIRKYGQYETSSAESPNKGDYTTKITYISKTVDSEKGYEYKGTGSEPVQNKTYNVAAAGKLILGTEFYRGYTVNLSFAIPKEALKEDTDETGTYFVKYINVIISVIDDGKVHQITAPIYIENEVKYKNPTTTTTTTP